MSKFEDKVAIVTGSATGIGYGISKRLSSENIKIIMVDYDGNMAEQSAGELIAKGGDVEVVIGDVSLPETAEGRGLEQGRYLTVAESDCPSLHQRVHRPPGQAEHQEEAAGNNKMMSLECATVTHIPIIIHFCFIGRSERC